MALQNANHFRITETKT